MLFAIALRATNDGRWRATAPDLLNCDLTGSTEQELLPKLRLAIEGELTRLLMANRPLPDSREGAPAPDFATGESVRWLNVHINMDHLRALARHQAGR